MKDLAKRRDECAGLVHLGLQTLHDGDGSEVPAAAEELTAFLRKAGEWLDGEPVTLDDVRCGLMRLRETRQVLALFGATAEDTRYALRSAVARSA